MEEKVMKETIKKGIVMAGEIALVNCTPHPLNIVQRDGTVLTIESSGIIPRCASTEEIDRTIGLIDVSRQHLGAVEGLPDPIPGAYFIVSRLVASAAKREDLLVPGALLRDDQGRVVGCKGLSLL